MKANPEKTDLSCAFVSTPLGILKLEAQGEDIVSIMRVSKSRQNGPRESLVVKKAKAEIEEYFQGKRKRFEFNFKLNGTDFEKSVWKEAKKIPFGKTCSYADLAKRIGRPKSFRAVGNALSKNRCLLLVPCHRILTKHRGLGGFSAGLNSKEILLNLEGTKWA